MNTADLLIKYTDLHLSALITARGFPVLGYSVESWDTFFLCVKDRTKHQHQSKGLIHSIMGSTPATWRPV